MTALSSQPPTLDHKPRAGRQTYNLNTAATVYAGGLVGVGTNGLLIPWADGVSAIFLGIALETRTEPADVDAPVDEGGVIVTGVPVAGSNQGSVGDALYCTTDNIREDCALAGNRVIGRVVKFRSATDCDVELFSAAEFAAAIA